jgi:outer membrane lipoprotein-sorting protein
MLSRYIALALPLALLLSLLGKVADAAKDAGQLLKDAETIRNPQEDYEVKVTLEDRKGEKREEHTYESLVKGRSKSLVKYLTPEIDKGTKVLMVDDQMWVYVPTTAKPIRIAARQRLTGNAAYGDVARLSFVDNYTAKILREDTFKGKKSTVLELSSVPGRPVTYDRVEYWIDAANQRPLKALYQTSSGKTLREGYFEDFKEVFGIMRPTKFVLVDVLSTDHTTNLIFSDAKKKKLPDLLFEKQNFGRN